MLQHIHNYVANSCNTIKLRLRRTLVLMLLKASFPTIIVLLTSCNNNQQHKHTEASVKELTTYYTCSMHPEIQQPNPGKCPICGMHLIKAEKRSKRKPDELQLSDKQIQLGNITVDTIGKSNMGDEVVLTATINFDQRKTSTISSRVMGRVERLYFKNIGDYVSKGQKLFDIYSEELNNAKQEYILALERQKVLDNSMIDFQQLIQSAKNKLLLWGMSTAQINELSKTKNNPTTSFYSNASGFITTLDVKEGDYVMEGGAVVHLADLSTLWVEAQVYTSELSKIDRGGTATVQIPDMPGSELRGNIEFINPEINAETRINLLRVTIPNANNHLKPGMPAYVYIKSKERAALTLPIDAVIRDGKGATVWIMTGKNTFKNKMVQTGLEVDDRIEITSGLKSGDVIVTTGAYLINSEYIFKNGANPMAGHDMKSM
jgi:membrane fusion protein, copper/silver efflux system